MKITIVGNSNSLLRDGWLQTFRQHFPQDEFLNVSVGGSSSPALLYQLHSRVSDIAGSDIIILEPTVVDHGTGWQSPAQIATYAYDTLMMARATGALPVLLVLPRNADYVATPSAGMFAWTGAAKRAGVQIIDTRHLLRDHSRQTGCMLETLWRDNMGHLTAEMQALVGNFTADFIKAAQQPAATPDILLGPHRALNGKEICQINNLAPISRATSLMAVDCAPLTIGQPVRLDLQPTEAILGLMLNYGPIDNSVSNTLEFSAQDGSATVRIDVRNQFMTSNFAQHLVAIFKAVSVPVGPCTLTFIGNTEMTVADQPANQLEIVGMLIGPKPILNDNWQADGIGPLPLPDRAL